MSWTVKPNADCASVAKSLPMTYQTYLLVQLKLVQAAIDWNAVKPAEAKKKKDSADSLVILVYCNTEGFTFFLVVHRYLWLQRLI